MRVAAAASAVLCSLIFLFVLYGLTRPVQPGIDPAPVIAVSLVILILSGIGALLSIRRFLR